MIAALGSAGGPDAFVTLRRLAGVESPDVRAAALQALAGLPEADARALAAARLDEADPRVRAAAVTATRWAHGDGALTLAGYFFAAAGLKSSGFGIITNTWHGALPEHRSPWS